MYFLQLVLDVTTETLSVKIVETASLHEHICLSEIIQANRTLTVWAVPRREMVDRSLQFIDRSSAPGSEGETRRV